MSGKQLSTPCLPFDCLTPRLLLLLLSLLQILLLFFSLTSMQMVGIAVWVLWVLVLFAAGAVCECFLVIAMLL